MGSEQWVAEIAVPPPVCPEPPGIPPPRYFRKRGCKLLKTKDGRRKKRRKRLQSTERKGDSWWRGTGIASNSWEKVPHSVSVSQVLSCKIFRNGGKCPNWVRNTVPLILGVAYERVGSTFSERRPEIPFTHRVRG